ncbi:MAG: hypothetical protein ACO3JL_20535 [Myxococcota bacterium]
MAPPRGERTRCILSGGCGLDEAEHHEQAPRARAVVEELESFGTVVAAVRQEVASAIGDHGVVLAKLHHRDAHVGGDVTEPQREAVLRRQFEQEHGVGRDAFLTGAGHECPGVVGLADGKRRCETLPRCLQAALPRLCAFHVSDGEAVEEIGGGEALHAPRVPTEGCSFGQRGRRIGVVGWLQAPLGIPDDLDARSLLRAGQGVVRHDVHRASHQVFIDGGKRHREEGLVVGLQRPELDLPRRVVLGLSLAHDDVDTREARPWRIHQTRPHIHGARRGVFDHDHLPGEVAEANPRGELQCRGRHIDEARRGEGLTTRHDVS